MKRSLAMALTLSSALAMATPQAHAAVPAGAKAQAQAAITKVEDFCTQSYLNRFVCAADLQHVLNLIGR